VTIAPAPLPAVITRKSCISTHYGMLDIVTGANVVFAQPTVQITIVGAETAASVIFAREIREADKPDEVQAQRIKEFSEIYENPYRAAERGYVDDVIDPSDIRKVINRALDVLEGKCVARPWRKYSNINL